jgi:hypothetical protein
MTGEDRERWLTLCAEAAKEQDPTKLLKLIQEIDSLLAKKAERLSKPPRAD